jgi:hypothetical protein
MRRLLPLLAGLVFVGGLVDAGLRRWLSDDAFISFRYALHAAAGHGFVYNIGEAVEGYTNFLWTALLSLGIRAGLPPEALSIALGLCSFGLLGGLLARSSQQIAAERGAGPTYLALMGLFTISTARDFATSGLETAFFLLLITATLLRSARAETERDWATVGLLGALAALCRPDGLGYLALALLPALARPRALLAGLAAPIVLVGPYALWKLHFYGDLVPNTFYAKEATASWWSQGLRYIGLFFASAPLVGIGLLAALGAGLMSLGSSTPRAPGLSEGRGPLLFLGAALLCLLPLARVGGDFMFGRLCLPAVPFVLLALEGLLPRLPLGRAGGLVALGLALSPLFGTLPGPLLAGEHLYGIADERRFYPRSALSQSEALGARLRELAGPVPLRLVIYGGQAMLAYHANADLAIEAATGLTDAVIARQPVGPNRWAGHDKDPPPGYLAARKVQLRVDFRTGLEPHPKHLHVDLGEGVQAYLITWDPALMARLAAAGAVFTDYTAYVDEQIAQFDALEDEAVTALWVEARRVLITPNDDLERDAAFVARLGRSDP